MDYTPPRIPSPYASAGLYPYLFAGHRGSADLYPLVVLVDTGAVIAFVCSERPFLCSVYRGSPLPVPLPIPSSRGEGEKHSVEAALVILSFSLRTAQYALLGRGTALCPIFSSGMSRLGLQLPSL